MITEIVGLNQRIHGDPPALEGTPAVIETRRTWTAISRRQA